MQLSITVTSKILFEMMKSYLVWLDLMFLFRPTFCKFFSLVEIWGWLTHFPITNFLCSYDYMLEKGHLLAFSTFLLFEWFYACFLIHIMEIFPKTHNFRNKTIVKSFLIVVKYFETTIKTKFLTVNHYLTNCSTKAWL